MTRTDDIDRFLCLDRIAFVGASRDGRTFADDVYRRLRANGHTLVPVNRAIQPGESIEGDEAYPDLASVPGTVDGVFVLVPPAEALDVAKAAIARGAEQIWFHRGVGAGCATPEAVALCREAGMSVVDGACPLMFDVPVRGVHRVHRAVHGLIHRT